MNLITLLFTLLNFRFIWLNLLFVSYLWLVQPVVLQRMEAAMRDQQPDWWLASILLGVQILEIVGLLLKRPVSAHYARHYPDSGDHIGFRDNLRIILYVFVPIFHLSFSAMLAMGTFGLVGLGLDDNTPAAWQCLQVLLVFIVITKEAFFIALMLSISPAFTQPATSSHSALADQLNRWLDAPKILYVSPQDALKNITGDLLLLAFSALAYTASWEFITATSPLRGQGAELLPGYVGLSLLFLTVFFTTRAVYLIQDISTQQSRMARAFSWISFLLLWLTALWSVPIQ